VALRDFGGIRLNKAECRRSHGVQLWDDLGADFRYAIRSQSTIRSRESNEVTASRPMNDIAKAFAILDRRISVDADDAASRYRLAVLLLDPYGRKYDPALLSQARDHLVHAIELRPRHAQSHAALGYACDLTEGLEEQALACYREARRLNPLDTVCEIHFIKLLENTGRGGEALVEIEAADLRLDVDLPGLRPR
jgi:tetratricopeptide (TPR) repeat protein